MSMSCYVNRIFPRRGTTTKQVPVESTMSAEVAVPLSQAQRRLNSLEARIRGCTGNLDLAGASVDDAMCGRLIKCIRANRRIRSISLRDNQIGNQGCNSIATLLSSNACPIASIVLSGNPIGDDGLSRIADALRTNVTLLEFNCVEIEASKNGVLALAAALACNTTLRRLLLRSYNMEVQAMAKLCHSTMATNGRARWELIELCPQYSMLLKSIPLNRLASDGTEVLRKHHAAREAHRQRRVQYMNKRSEHALVHHNGVLDLSLVEPDATVFNSWISSLTTMQTTQHIVQLDLSSNALCEIGGAESIVDALIGTHQRVAALPFLRVLLLADNGFVDSDALCLSDALRVHTKLRHVDLSSNAFSSVGLNAIAESAIVSDTIRILLAARGNRSPVSSAELATYQFLIRMSAGLRECDNAACLPSSDVESNVRARFLLNDPRAQDLLPHIRRRGWLRRRDWVCIRRHLNTLSEERMILLASQAAISDASTALGINEVMFDAEDDNDDSTNSSTNGTDGIVYWLHHAPNDVFQSVMRFF